MLKQHLPQSEMMKEPTPKTVLCYNTGEQMYIFKPLLTLTNVSGTWRSMQQKLNLDNSQHLKFSVCVNRLNDTNVASSALNRDIIQFAGERDMGSQETAHLLLEKNRCILALTPFFVSHWMEVEGFVPERMMMKTREIKH